MTLTFESGKFVLRKNEASVIKTLGEAVRLKRYADDRARKVIERITVKRYAPALRLPKFLDPHQVEGVQWALTRSRSYLAHCAGAGKTCEAIIAACHTLGEGQVLFIVPPTLTANWEREIRHWMTEIDWMLEPTITVIPETAKRALTDWSAEFIICPDSMLAKDWVLARLTKLKIKFLAVDEASRFKESTSARTIALFGGKTKDLKSPGLVYKPRHAVLLDGSPMPNRAMELWAPTYAMAPACIDYMGQQEFGFRYCGATLNNFGQWEFKHTAREEELRKRLQVSFMHVVTESQLKHAERLRSIVVTNEDVRTSQIKKWEKSVLSKLSIDVIHEKADQGDLAKWAQEIGLRKVPFIARYVKEKLEKGESILLFVWHREVAQNLAQKLNCAPIIGGTPAKEREQAIKDFQNGRTKLIIGNIGALGRGHNLQNANRIVFGEYSWTDETNKQCEKRASRKGRKSLLSVRCDYLVCPNSLDEIKLRSLFRKASAVEKVIG